MIIGIGTDIVQIDRIDRALKQYGGQFINRILTPFEQEGLAVLSPKQQTAYLAKRYAIKEAVVKALGCGIGARASWLDIEVRNDELGAPYVVLSGRAEETLAHKCRQAKIHISVSDDVNAVAFVVIEETNESGGVA